MSTRRRRRVYESAYPSIVNVRVSDDDRLALDLLAELEGVTLAVLVRRLVRDALDRAEVRDHASTTG